VFKSKWNYHDANVIDLRWQSENDLFVTVQLDGHWNGGLALSPTMLIFRGVTNREEIDAVWEQHRMTFGVGRCIEGFLMLDRGHYRLGLDIHCQSVQEV
jgi:hypothetical protein